MEDVYFYLNEHEADVLYDPMQILFDLDTKD